MAEVLEGLEFLEGCFRAIKTWGITGQILLAVEA